MKKIIITLTLITALLTPFKTHATYYITQPQIIEYKIAIVKTDTQEGNYIEFVDNSGGWWLESDTEHSNFEEGQILKLTIDNMGTENIEDDELLIIENFGFIN